MKEYAVHATGVISTTIYVLANSEEDALEAANKELHDMEHEEWDIESMELHEDSVREIEYERHN